MLVRDLQQVLGNFTDKFNGRLSEIQKIEAHENTLIGATEGLRVVLKLMPQNKSKIIL